MRGLLFVASIALVSHGWSGTSHAATLCVSPGQAGCSATIQGAVDLAAQGDEILVLPKADGSAYREAVVITTGGLTITGGGDGARFRNLKKMVEFSILRKPVDLGDPDVKRWLKLYPNGKEFKTTVNTLKKFAKQKQFVARCPEVVVEVCETPETGPDLCGIADPNAPPVFSVQAPGTTISDLTIRHGNTGIVLEEDVTDTTVENTCLRRNSRAIESQRGGNHRTAVRRSFVDGASNFEGFDIEGDDLVLEYNLLLNTEGIEVEGARYRISNNAISVTTDNSCIEADGAEGEIAHNVLLDCATSLILDDGAGTLVVGNLISGVADDSIAIDARDVPESSTNPAEPGNLGTVLRHNIIRLVSGSGVEFGASEGIVEGNLIERTGNDRREAGVEVRGNANQVRDNLIRSGSRTGIQIGNHYNAVLDEEEPSQGNVIRGNLLIGNHTSGVYLLPGSVWNMVAKPSSAGTLIEDNVIERSDGEGVAIPVGEVPAEEPPAVDVTLVGNQFEGNRTDICNEGPSTVLGPGNVFATGGLTTICVVEGD